MLSIGPPLKHCCLWDVDQLYVERLKYYTWPPKKGKRRIEKATSYDVAGGGEQEEEGEERKEKWVKKEREIEEKKTERRERE